MKKRNKTIIILIAAIVLLMLAFSCGHRDGAQESTQESTQETTVTTQTEQTQAASTEQTTEAPRASYTFRYNDLLQSHYEKHGIEMGFDSAQEYLDAANAVIANPDALTKTEKEDGDMVYYVEKTNEFVVLSTDGYIRTYFCPDGGKGYFDRQ